MTVHVQMKTLNSCYSRFDAHINHDIQQHGVLSMYPQSNPTIGALR